MADLHVLIEGLNQLQSNFVWEYCKDFRGGPAMVRAGYSVKGADQAASKQLRLPKVREAVQKISVEARERCLVSKDENIKRLQAVANASIDQIMHWREQKTTWVEEGQDGKPVKKSSRTMVLTVKDFNELTKEQLYAIESMEQTRYGIKVKLRDSNTAQDMLNRHIGFYDKDKPANPFDGVGGVLVLPHNDRQGNAPAAQTTEE